MEEKKRLLLEKERHFREFQIWPLSSRLDIRSWLSNFDTPDVDMALRLADAFVYVTESLVDAMFAAAIQLLINRLSSGGPGDVASSRIGYVIVQGEAPNATDSGHLFARKLRDKIGIPQKQILLPAEALARAPNFQVFVFVDDFVGSGEQMRHTWTRRWGFPDGTMRSFAGLASRSTHIFAYCPAVCSSLGAVEIARKLPQLILSPAHSLSEQDSITHAGAMVWRGMDPSQGISFVKRYSLRAGYSAEDGSEEDWRGFNKQALTLAFNHGTPDATLPIFYSTRLGWQPLVRQ